MRRTIIRVVVAAAMAFAVAPVAFGDSLEGLIAYWPLDETDGGTWRDQVGDHDARVDQVGEWTDEAQIGGAFRFVEQTLVKVDDSDDINELQDGFSIAHWMKPSGGGAIMDKSASDAVRIQWYWLGDRHHWGLGAGVGFAPGGDNPRDWMHVAGESIVYRDGEEVGREPLGDVPATDEPMYFGNRLPDENRQEWFREILDEMGFWNRPLSAEEVNEVMDRGLAGLVAVSPAGKAALRWADVKRRR